MNKKKITRLLLIAFVCISMLSGCGQQAANTSETTPSQISVASTPEPTPTPTPVPTPEPKKEIQWDTDTLKNDSGKTLIKCISDRKDGRYHSGFGIVSSQGTVILADPVYTPGDKGYLKADIITVSHGHSDHYDQMFLDKMEGYAEIASIKPRDFTVKDVNVFGVLASHTSNYPNEATPSNVIFVYDLDGLRIAHMGGMGQLEMLPEQLEKLGQLDIIFTGITNLPNNGTSTAKNIKIIEQLKPKIVIPTHYNDDVLSETIEHFGVKEVEKMPELVISKEDLKDAEMRFIIVE